MLFLLDYSTFIISGFLITVEVTLIGVGLGLILGILAALGDIFGGRIVKIIVNVYVEFFRGSPLIVQLFIFYFTIPMITGVSMDVMVTAILTLALNSGAYQKGYLKGAMEAVFKDQLMAALSLGLPMWKIFLYVVIPQALRIVIPAWSNELASMGKSTTALIVIGVREFLNTGISITAQTFRPLETYAFITITYFIWIYSMLKALDILYNKVKIPGLEPII
ncbi:MAG: amino acid ABC transporter permease [Thaumarchaeota archaeon]|jgi:polar amino acid transport system permease protein|nr:amino acid ABC transporter permease [Candidatus Geocrenenecus arthurdayi]